MLTHRPHPPRGSALAGQDLWGLLQLMDTPADIRRSLLEAKQAEDSARKAITELEAAQKKVAEGEAANAATAARLAELERNLNDARTKLDAEQTELKEKTAQERRKLDAEREDLRERISRQQALERESASRKEALDAREKTLAAGEKALESRRASFEELAAMLEAKGLGGKR